MHISPRLYSRTAVPRNSWKANFFKEYQRFDEIENYIKRLSKEHPSVANIFSIGKSIEGRNLNVIKIGSQNLPAIWIDGGIHAREWISSSTVTYIATRLVAEFRERPRKIINSPAPYFCWYILPMTNPDGYEYSHTKDRLWRKNRNMKNESCPGVDLNRNFGFHWNEGGSSQDPCDELYSGVSAFSEPETKAISNFLLEQSKKQKIVAFLSFHSFGQMWLTPWGWTKELHPEHNDLEMVARKAVAAIYKVNGTKYKINSTSRSFDVATGGSDDWANGAAGIKYSYVVELPDRGRYGFQLPKRYILPVGKETWEGVKAFSKAIKEQIEKECLLEDAKKE